MPTGAAGCSWWWRGADQGQTFRMAVCPDSNIVGGSFGSSRGAFALIFLFLDVAAERVDLGIDRSKSGYCFSCHELVWIVEGKEMRCNFLKFDFLIGSSALFSSLILSIGVFSHDAAWAEETSTVPLANYYAFSCSRSSVIFESVDDRMIPISIDLFGRNAPDIEGTVIKGDADGNYLVTNVDFAVSINGSDLTVGTLGGTYFDNCIRLHQEFQIAGQRFQEMLDITLGEGTFLASLLAELDAAQNRDLTELRRRAEQAALLGKDISARGEVLMHEVQVLERFASRIRRQMIASNSVSDEYRQEFNRVYFEMLQELGRGLSLQQD